MPAISTLVLWLLLKKNIEQAGFSAQIQTVLTDGLQGLEQYPITDVTIAGIGGEVITDILKQAAF